MSDEELTLWLRLLLTPGLGRSSARKILGVAGAVDAVFSLSEREMREVLSAAQVRALSQPPTDLAEHLQRTKDWLKTSEQDGIGRGVVTLADAHYPTPLLAGDDPPLMLWWCGTPGLDVQKTSGGATQRWRAIAIVGTRNPTPQGVINARQFAKSLAQDDLCVVSGLASGIDVAAHEGALSAPATESFAHLAEASGAAGFSGGHASPAAAEMLPWPTIAIVGTGLDRVYPRRNLTLAHQIASRGLLLSEYPPQTPPLAAHFPQRNRLIAGLSLGTLVVEAALHSGSLITARIAAELGREVMAVPGSIHSPQSRGCHALLREGARLVEASVDVLQELSLDQRQAPPGKNRNADEWPRFEARAPMQGSATSTHAGDPLESCSSAASADDSLLLALGHDAVSVDELLMRTGLSLSELQVSLLHQELAGTVARIPGGRYQRIASQHMSRT